MRARLFDNILPDGNTEVTRTVRDLINDGMCLFDTCDPYPIWKEDHRPELEKKIIEHYMFRQIGFETAGRFKFELNKLMREIMPYYIEMYKTTLFKYNPIENYSMMEHTTDETAGDETAKGESLSKYSDTPQGSVDRIDKYLTSATKDDNSGSRTHKNKLTHDAWRKGNIGVTTTQQMIQAERDIIINIDMMIVEELQVLFLGVY